LMSAIHVLGLAGKLGDADQVRRGIHRIQGKGSHIQLHSSFVRHQYSTEYRENLLLLTKADSPPRFN
jgi:hypothetical protein